MKRIILGIWSLLLTGCLGYPTNVQPVKNFELNRYLGKWYEIARLDHSFERGLQNVSAEYSLREDGGVMVKNIGCSVEDNKWKEAIGKAYFVREDHEGYLKVSFFGPFYGSYVIFDLDTVEYQYSFVSSSTRSFLWLLSRSPEVSNEIKEKFIKMANDLQFDTSKLIWVNQEKVNLTN